MQSSSKLNEHPRCGCFHCRHHSGTAGAQHLHRLVNRRVRHAYNVALRFATETPMVVVSTPPTS